MSRLKVVSSVVKGLYYATKVLILPKDVYTLLKLGDLLTDTKSFKLYVDSVMADPKAAELVKERYNKIPLSIKDLDVHPEGSLGHAFKMHLVSNGLDIYTVPIKKEYSDAVYLRERQRATHDLFHAVFGLGIEIPDEAELNAIIMAQHSAPISILIVAGSLIHSVFKKPLEVSKLIQSISNAYVRAKSMPSVFSIKWEEYLDRPVEEVRQLFLLKA